MKKEIKCRNPNCASMEFQSVLNDEMTRVIAWKCCQCSLHHPFSHISIEVHGQGDYSPANEKIYCNDCGKDFDINTDAKFCDHCGASLLREEKKHVSE
ncbi:MAG: hypothetical protein FWE47_00125 [Oscillospiraceae bacterium]|nr:hypothetical protein [Oscillospiraceae bacterium]